MQKIEIYLDDSSIPIVYESHEILVYNLRDGFVQIDLYDRTVKLRLTWFGLGKEVEDYNIERKSSHSFAIERVREYHKTC